MPFAPGATGLVDGSKHGALGDAGGRRPCVDARLHPNRHGHRSDVSGLSEQVGDDPMVVTLLDGSELEPEQFTAAKSTADEHREHGMIPQIPRRCP
jgi:hypothetical protein